MDEALWCYKWDGWMGLGWTSGYDIQHPAHKWWGLPCTQLQIKMHKNKSNSLRFRRLLQKLILFPPPPSPVRNKLTMSSKYQNSWYQWEQDCNPLRFRRHLQQLILFPPPPSPVRNKLTMSSKYQNSFRILRSKYHNIKYYHLLVSVHVVFPRTYPCQGERRYLRYFMSTDLQIKMTRMHIKENEDSFSTKHHFTLSLDLHLIYGRMFLEGSQHL